MRTTLILPVLALLQGCASLSPPDAYYQAQAAAAVAQATAEQARAARPPDLVLQCASGCYATYTHPDQGPARPAAPAINEGITAGAVGVALIQEAGAVLRSVSPYAALYGVAARGLDAAGDRLFNVQGDGNTLNQDTNTLQRWGDGSGNDHSGTAPAQIVRPEVVAPDVVPIPVQVLEPRVVYPQAAQVVYPPPAQVVQPVVVGAP